MNEEALTILNKILLMEPEALNGEHAAFLKARRDYLTEEQRLKYGLGEPAIKVEKPKEPKTKKPAKR